MSTRASARLAASAAPAFIVPPRPRSSAGPGPSKLRYATRSRGRVPPYAESDSGSEDDEDEDGDAGEDGGGASDGADMNHEHGRGAPVHVRHLNQPVNHAFQPNDAVWVCHHEKWIGGRIFAHAAPKLGANDNHVYYSVVYRDAYGHNLRRYFSPNLGELKPDSAPVRKLLRAAGWL